jgi:hypothetical protein
MSGSWVSISALDPLLDPAADLLGELLDLLLRELLLIERSDLFGIGSLDPSGDSINALSDRRDRKSLPLLDGVSRTELPIGRI